MIKITLDNFETKHDKHIKSLDNYLCVFAFFLGFYSFYTAFYLERHKCGSLNSLNRIHGIILFIYDSLGLLFALMVYVNNFEIKMKEKEKNVRYVEWWFFIFL